MTVRFLACMIRDVFRAGGGEYKGGDPISGYPGADDGRVTFDDRRVVIGVNP
jgi:hypothetical protein